MFIIRRQRRRNYRSGIYRHDDYNSGNNGILLAEFMLYNKEKQIIKPDVLKDIETKLISNKSKNIFWTNDDFAKHGVGFKFYMKEVAVNDKLKNDVFINIIEHKNITFKSEEFNSCRHIIYDIFFIGFELNENQLSFLNDLDYENYMSDGEITISKNWDEVIDALISSKVIEKYDSNSEWKEFRDDLILLGINIEKKQEYSQIKKRSGFGNTDVYHIIKVVERRIKNINYRLAVLCSPIQNYGDNSYTFRVIDETEIDYVRIDEGRLFFRKSNKYFYLDMDTNEYIDNKLIINNDLLSLMEDNISTVLNIEQNLITTMIYAFYKDRAMKFEFNEDNLTERQKAINKRYVELLKENREIKIGDLRISKRKICLNNENFSLEFNDSFLDVIKEFNAVRNALNVADASYNFNIIFEKLIEISTLKYVRQEWVREHQYKSWTGTKFKINGMSIEVKKIGNRININGIFCRIDDVWFVLSKLICYRDINEYNKYLKDVSYIGIDWKKMISNGIAIELHNPFHTIFSKMNWVTLERMYMRFSLLWDKQLRRNVYLMLNGQKYLIKYKGKFKKYFNVPRRVLNVVTLRNELAECIEGLDNNMIINIVENAVKEAEIIQKRGRELVQMTVKDIKAKLVEEEISGTITKGYLLFGRVSGTKYFIKSLDLEVYRWDNGSWNRRCVVDDGSKERIFEDRLANRLVNIYNEPTKIFTLHNN